MNHSQSQKNRKELKAVWQQFQDAGYADMSITINASSVVSEDGAVAEVLHTLKAFLADKNKKPSTMVL